MSIPAQQKALVLESKFGKFALQTTDVPRPGPGDLLVKIEAAALNPADWKIQTYGILVNEYPVVLGADGSGIVIAVGEKISPEAFAVGDRVCYMVLIVSTSPSPTRPLQSFRTTCLSTKQPLFRAVLRRPPCRCTTMSKEQIQSSSSLLGRRAEGESTRESRSLSSGGATSMGQFAIQFARLSGFSPIVATASRHHAAFLKTLGATHVVDRKLSTGELQAEFAKIASGQFEVVYDAVSLADTFPLSLAATAPGGHLVVVLSAAEIAEEAEKQGKNVHHARGWFVAPINREVSGPLLASLPKLLETGDIKPNRVEVLPGGLNGVVSGLERLKANQVSGVKLVVHPQETA